MLKRDLFGVLVVNVGYCLSFEFSFVSDVVFFLICYSLLLLVFDEIVSVKMGFFLSCVKESRLVFEGFICEDVILRVM